MTETTPSLPPHLSQQLDVLMIDNFDSFTWNLYQQLCLLGANVTVIRNDAILPVHLPQLRINSLIISPGPGHPRTDSGISREAIQYFTGKVPILGVCMGLECLVDLYGGSIGYAGEIMHGKVSRIRHDNRGCFRNVPQGIKSIRYHSLSASYQTLPSDLAITSVTEESGVIMGVRHRKYTLEAVQYHPESILSESGDGLVKNFLSLRGGLWEQNPELHVLDASLPLFLPERVSPESGAVGSVKVDGVTEKVPSILDKIHKQRLADVDQAQATPGSTTHDLLTLHSLNVCPPQIDFLARIKQNTSPGRPGLFAEIKRASPSKGPIAVSINPAAQALKYALAGVHTISVLTEPKWFLGSLHDMLHARQAVANLPNRPAILRKDFIVSRYQVLESRIWGADTILLIVSMLSESLLRDLYAYAKELGMEPLVEVNNAREMEIALSLSAKVIGVNNRNLHDFNVDMSTTSRLSDMTKDKDVVLCALSGITSRADVDRYKGQGVSAVLVGESLMRAKDTAAFIRHLLDQPDPEPETGASESTPLVKICGVKTREQALQIADAGADLLGLMFVKKSKRYVDRQNAKAISAAIRERRFDFEFGSSPSPPAALNNTPWFTANAERLAKITSKTCPLLVGVFQNHSLEEILETVADVQLDLVQLHGNEPVDWASHIPVPVIRVFHLGSKDGELLGVEGITRPGPHQFVLLDSMRDDGLSGGSGKIVDWGFAKKVVDGGEILVNGKKTYLGSVDGTQAATNSISKHHLPIILAGGLTPENVASAVKQVRPWAVDVSGGVELADGSAKDLDKVREFIAYAKGHGSDSGGE